ncbi:MAG: hypothetical protein VR69_03195 [Peptococcaceae bacterium BRH_c4b]|nr:MAG: hypothetical protein VR69_03195 [Peptococcaceae bacterium BRH_c4b]
MAFEVYKPRGEKQEKQPVVSLSKTSIVLNNVAREKLSTDRIELAYDPETDTIRIKAAENGSGMEVKKTKVFGKGFYNQFNIKKKGKFEARYDKEENALYVQL